MKLSFAVLKDRDASRLVMGQLVSQACDKMMTVGLVWVLTQNTSAQVIPWFLGVSALPHLLLSRHAGKWTVQWGPLKTVVLTDLLRGLLFFLLFFIWPLIPQSQQIPALFVFVFLSNMAGALFNTAILSLPAFMPQKNLIQQLTAFIDTCFSFGNILGPLLSAVLYPVLGLKGLFIFNGASYFLAAFMESKIKMAPVENPEAAPLVENASLGKVFRKDSLVAFMLGLFLAMNLFLGPLMVFLPLFVKGIYQGSINTLAWLETSMALGMVLGGVFLSVANLNLRRGKIISAMMVVAISYLGFTFAKQPWEGALCLLVLGAFLAMSNIFALNLFQVRPAQQDVPTVMSLVNLISVASLPVSMICVGFLVEKIEIHRLALSFGCILLAITLGAFFHKELRNQ